MLLLSPVPFLLLIAPVQCATDPNHDTWVAVADDIAVPHFGVANTWNVSLLHAPFADGITFINSHDIGRSGSLSEWCFLLYPFVAGNETTTTGDAANFAPPRSQNNDVVLQVWRKTGARTFQLLHNFRRLVTSHTSLYRFYRVTVPPAERVHVGRGDHIGLSSDRGNVVIAARRHGQRHHLWKFALGTSTSRQKIKFKKQTGRKFAVFALDVVVS